MDVFDMARLRLQAPVRRPHSRNMEPRNLLRIHDSLQLKYPGKSHRLNCTLLQTNIITCDWLTCMYVCESDGESRLGFSEVPKLEEVGLTSRRRRDYRDPYQQTSSQRSTAQDGESSLQLLKTCSSLCSNFFRGFSVVVMFICLYYVGD